jgi:hypothetical protein
MSSVKLVREYSADHLLGDVVGVDVIASVLYPFPKHFDLFLADIRYHVNAAQKVGCPMVLLSISGGRLHSAHAEPCLQEIE